MAAFEVSETWRTITSDMWDKNDVLYDNLKIHELNKRYSFARAVRLPVSGIESLLQLPSKIGLRATLRNPPPKSHPIWTRSIFRSWIASSERSRSSTSVQNTDGSWIDGDWNGSESKASAKMSLSRSRKGSKFGWYITLCCRCMCRIACMSRSLKLRAVCSSIRELCGICCCSRRLGVCVDVSVVGGGWCLLRFLGGGL